MPRLAPLVLLVLLAPAPAAAQVPALAVPPPDAEPGVSVALAGGEVLVGRTTRHGGAAVDAVAVGGGVPRRLFTVPRPPVGRARARVRASAERVVVLWAVDTQSDAPPGPVRLYAGPPAGPLTPIEDDPSSGWVAVDAVVDGSRIALLEIGGGFSKFRLRVLEPAGETVAALPEGAFPFDFAGDLVASGGPRGLVVSEWRTGTERYAVAVAEAESVDLHADGSVLADGRLIRPGAAPVALRADAELLRWAGARIAGADDGADGRLARAGMLRPDGRLRRVGWRTLQPGAFVTSESHLAWVAGACVMVAPLDAPVLAAPPPGPCGRSEAVADADPPGPGAAYRVRDGAVRLGVRCAVAPSRGCRGTVRLVDRGRTVGRGSYAMSAGRSRSVRVRLLRRRIASFLGLRVDERDGLGTTTGGNAILLRR